MLFRRARRAWSVPPVIRAAAAPPHESRQLPLGLVVDLLFALLLLREELLVDPFHIDDRVAGKLDDGARLIGKDISCVRL